MLPEADIDRLTEVVVVPCCEGAGKEVVPADAEEEAKGPFTGVVVCDWKGQWLTLGGHFETVETSVTDTMTSLDGDEAELPLDTAGDELPLVEIGAEVCNEGFVVGLLIGIEELELRTPTDGATLVDGTSAAEELTACAKDVAWVVDRTGVVTALVEEAAGVECTVAEEVTGGETVHSEFSRYPLRTSAYGWP